MALKPFPKTSHPTFPVLVPTYGRAARFRPFTVKEEKILLMARESTKVIDHLRAVHQVVLQCLEDVTVDSTQLSTFDVDWLFAKITASSVREVVTQAFNDIEERERGIDPLPVYSFDIRLDDIVAPVLPEGYDPEKGFTITLEDGSGVVLRYPPAVLYTDEAFVEAGQEALLFRATKKIFTADGEYYDVDDGYELKDVVEYYDSWTMKDMTKVTNFLSSTPSMSWTQKYVNSLGSEREIKLTALTDFFTF